MESTGVFCLADKIEHYVQGGMYPMHMPGHKRNMPAQIRERLRRIWELDLTEVKGSDSLHHAEGIIKEAQDYAARIYGAKQTFFLINGSSCGILAAIHACAHPDRKKIIMVKESHISVYNAVDLNQLEPILIPSYTVLASDCDSDAGTVLRLKAGVNTELLFQAIAEHHRETCAVCITSPTYEGIVSDVGRIAAFVHRHGLPLIVDEAHGAHLRFMQEHTGIASSINLGADIVIQSVHKTLPALTQTAVMHLSGDCRIRGEKIRESLSIFESSSPSYVLMSSIDLAIRYMANAKEEIRALFDRQREFYDRCRGLEYVKVVQEYHVQEEAGKESKAQTEIKKEAVRESKSPEEAVPRVGLRESEKTPVIWDSLKVVIYSKKQSGTELADFLRRKHRIEPEMAAGDYVLCMLTVGDTVEGIEKLCLALWNLDACLKQGQGIEHGQSMERCEALHPHRGMRLRGLLGVTAKHPVYAFPPDIPIVRKGEMISEEQIRMMEDAINKGLRLYGLEDYGKDIYDFGEECFR